MALVARELSVDGKKIGTAYLLENAGDEFPVHTHDESTIHYTILAYGSVRCTGRHSIDGVVLKAKPGGTIVNWQPGEPHGFVALEDGATLVNILKNP